MKQKSFSISDMIFSDYTFLRNIVNRKRQHNSEYNVSLLSSFISYEDDNLLTHWY